MKMIKLIGLAAAFMLTGCANMETMMNAKSDPVFLLRECKAIYASDEKIESCFIKKMERRDVDRVKVGLAPQTQMFKDAIKEAREEESRKENKHQEEESRKENKHQEEVRKQQEESAKLEKIKARDRCIIMTNMQLENEIRKAAMRGNYERYDELNSDEFKEKALKYCNDLAK